MDKFEEEELDPRIQEELEKLNGTAAQINELEVHLDEIRRNFNKLMAEGSKEIEEMKTQIGENALRNAKPYMMAYQLRKQAQQDTQDATVRYERACSMLALAREMEQNTEKKAQQCEGPLDSALQEMLNHATMKVNEAKQELLESQAAHIKATDTYQRLDMEVRQHEKDHKNDIKKCKPYFQKMQRFTDRMQEEKEHVQLYEEKVSICKNLYSETLRALEKISLEIHEKRDIARLRFEMGQRGEGVGQESSPVLSDDTGSLDAISIKSENLQPLEDANKARAYSECEERHLPPTSQRTRPPISSSMRRLKLKKKLESNAMPLVGQLQKALQEQATEFERYKANQLTRSGLVEEDFPLSDSSSLSSNHDISSGVQHNMRLNVTIPDWDSTILEYQELPTPKPGGAEAQ